MRMVKGLTETCKARVVILRSNPIAPDPRVEKEAQALTRGGYKIEIIGWDRTASFPIKEEKSFGTIYRLGPRAFFGKGLRNLPYVLRWQVSLLRWLWRNRARFDIIHACDFDTVLPALCIARLFRKRLVYDIFDFYADMLRNVPTLIKKIIRTVDLWVIGKADAVIIADESRKEQIKGGRPKLLEVIYNSPQNFTVVQDGEKNVQDAYQLRIVYVGLLQVERGLLEMLEVMAKHPEWRLDLAGFGGDEAVILSTASRLSNVTFHGRLPYAQALKLMAEADVLFATYDPKIPNHRYASPNKVFEAMMLGKPIIVARGMGVDKLVEQYRIGFIVEYGDVEELEKVLYELTKWTEEQKRAFAFYAQRAFSERFAWEKMEKALIALYHKISCVD